MQLLLRVGMSHGCTLTQHSRFVFQAGRPAHNEEGWMIVAEKKTPHMKHTEQPHNTGKCAHIHTLTHTHTHFLSLSLS